MIDPRSDRPTRLQLHNGNNPREAHFLQRPSRLLYDSPPLFDSQHVPMKRQQPFATLWYCEKLTWSFAVREYPATPVPKQTLQLSGRTKDGAFQSLEMQIDAFYQFLGALDRACDLIEQFEFARIRQPKPGSKRSHRIAAGLAFSISITESNDENRGTRFSLQIFRHQNSKSAILTLRDNELFEFMADAQDARLALCRHARRIGRTRAMHKGLAAAGTTRSRKVAGK